MKADQFGTLSEQIRWKRGWRTASQRKAEGWPAGETCQTCRHAWERAPGTWKCGDAGLATAPGATCRHWEAKP